LEEAVAYAQLRHWPEGLGEVQLKIGGDDQDLWGSRSLMGGAVLKRCGRGEMGGYGYVRELDESLRMVLRGVRDVTLVDMNEHVLMHVSEMFRNAKIECA
jgi:hypothetical protein